MMTSDRTAGVGIDLGTSYSAISRVDIASGRPVFAEAKELAGGREVPSVVFVDRAGLLVFGHPAEMMQNNPHDAHRVIPNVKLLLRSNQPIELDGLDEPIEPEAIVRGLLSYLKSCFERTMQVPLTHAVVTVPAHEEFDVDYRARVRSAAMSGDPLFESFTTVPEPDAVLLSIGDLSKFKGSTVLVFDMGGGTLDVSIREVDNSDGDRPFLRQLAVVGSDAAGRRVTEQLAELAVERWQREKGITFNDSDLQLVLRNNFLAVDDAKKSLSTLSVQFGHDSKKPHDVRLFSPLAGSSSYAPAVTVADFVRLSRVVCEDARATVEKALARAGRRAEEIDHYFVVGGSSQLPVMRDLLVEVFGGRPPEPLMGVYGTIDPTLAVVRGAAIDDLDRCDEANVPLTTPRLERKLPYAISLLVNGGRSTEVLLERDSVLPFGPVTRQFYVPSSGDRSIDLILVRGDGDPDQCPVISPSTVEFLEPGVQGDRLTISWFIDQSGEMTVTAFDKLDRELGVIRTNHMEE